MMTAVGVESGKGVAVLCRFNSGVRKATEDNAFRALLIHHNRIAVFMIVPGGVKLTNVKIACMTV